MTKYERVQDWVVKELQSGRLQPGDMLPSEAELCRMLSVGRNSVRTALSNLAHDRVVETRKGVGTFCLTPRQPSSMTIGFVCLYSQEYIFPKVVRGSNRVLSRFDYHLVLAESRRDTAIERNVLERLWKRGVDGIILQPAYDGRESRNLDLLHDIQASGVPVVLVDNHYPGEQFNSVIMNDRAGGHLAASYLWEHGHRSFGIVYHRTYYPKVLRMEGACSFLREMGHEVEENWLVGFDHLGNLEEVNRRLRQSFSRSSKDRLAVPTAFVCSNDEEAIELIRVAQRMGLRVPEDLSIVSFDNSSLSDLPSLTLTSVDHPSEEMGEMATTIILDKLKYPDLVSSTVTVIEPKLIERGSVAARTPEVPARGKR